MSIQQQQLDALLAIRDLCQQQLDQSTAWIAEMRAWRVADDIRDAQRWRHVETRDIAISEETNLFHGQVIRALEQYNTQEQVYHDTTLAVQQRWREEDLACNAQDRELAMRMTNVAEQLLEALSILQERQAADDATE